MTASPADLHQQADPAQAVWAKNSPALAIAMSAAVFDSAPVVILASDKDPAAVTAAAKHAAALGAPVLLTGVAGDGSGDDSADEQALAGEIGRLGARWVLATDAGSQAVAKRFDGVQTVPDAGDLPTISPPAPDTGLTVIVPADPVKDMTAGMAAAQGTASAAGARIQRVHGPDPRADPKAITALAAHPPQHVIGLGPDFGPADRLAARVSTAATGVQLPGGGQVMFPGRTLVALYGHPATGSLGALGQQGLSASIAHAKKVAAQYDKLATTPVIPTFEIIATVATAEAGSDGDYSAETSVASLKPWVQAATDAGMYVILDLQPGRARLLDQAKLYTELLRMPAVGLALDPEWKLEPGQVPLKQIGGVEASEVNEVIHWLSALTAKHHLPQKVLVLHQFRVAMLRDAKKIDTRDDNVSVLIHMDGQGAPNLKEETWRWVVKTAPKGVTFGWKNFYVKDTPMMNPAQTMDRKPVPVMISYQ